MKNERIIDHEITAKICESRELMAKKLQQEFKRYNIEKDDYDAEFLVEELTDSMELEIFATTYQLEFLTDVLFEALIKNNIITFEKAQKIWGLTKSDEGKLKKTYEAVIKVFEED